MSATLPLPPPPPPALPPGESISQEADRLHFCSGRPGPLARAGENAAGTLQEAAGRGIGQLLSRCDLKPAVPKRPRLGLLM